MSGKISGSKQKAAKVNDKGSKIKVKNRNGTQSKAVKTEDTSSVQAVPNEYSLDKVSHCFKDGYKNRQDVEGFDGHMHDAPQSFQEWTSWVPVRSFRSHLSPQSHKSVRSLTDFYECDLKKAWADGWRWMLTKHNHQWFPPQHMYEDEGKLGELVNLCSRGGINKGSVSSPDVERIINSLKAAAQPPLIEE